MNSPKIVGIIFLLSLFIGTLPCLYAQNCYKVSGTVGASSQWGSGWIEVPATTAFKKGERLRLELGGTAAKALVRVLASGQSPDDPIGILGEFKVPESRILEVTLQEEVKNVRQISVHGGANPWGRFPLGANNGPATLTSVERCSP